MDLEMLKQWVLDSLPPELKRYNLEIKSIEAGLETWFYSYVLQYTISGSPTLRVTVSVLEEDNTLELVSEKLVSGIVDVWDIAKRMHGL